MNTVEQDITILEMKIGIIPLFQNTTTSDDARTEMPSQSVSQTTHETLIELNCLTKQNCQNSQ
jgi:hypothetical protein